jgi:hypothetical protein
MLNAPLSLGVTAGSHRSYKSHGTYTTYEIYATNASPEKHPRSWAGYRKMDSRFRGLMSLTFSCRLPRNELTSEQLPESTIEKAPFVMAPYGRHNDRLCLR